VPSPPGIFPDYSAPVVRNAGDDRGITMMRWGMPSSQRAMMDATKKRAQKLQAKGTQVDFKELPRMERDAGVTNIRNTSSAHWKKWLGPENRCLVPFTSFAGFDCVDGKKVQTWFAADASRTVSNGLRCLIRKNWMLLMLTRDYFMKQALTLLRVAQQVSDKGVAARLRMLAADYKEKAQGGQDFDRLTESRGGSLITAP
jgi:hypothetical protein